MFVLLLLASLAAAQPGTECRCLLSVFYCFLCFFLFFIVFVFFCFVFCCVVSFFSFVCFCFFFLFFCFCFFVLVLFCFFVFSLFFSSSCSFVLLDIALFHHRNGGKLASQVMFFCFCFLFLSLFFVVTHLFFRHFSAFRRVWDAYPGDDVPIDQLKSRFSDFVLFLYCISSLKKKVLVE